MATPSSRCPPGTSLSSSATSSTLSGSRRSLVTSKPILIKPELKGSNISNGSPKSSPSSPLVATPSPIHSLTTTGYDITKLLGYGSFAKVYLATDAQTKEFVAIKRMRIQLSEEQKRLKVIERFEQEMEMMKSLRHANIIQFRHEYKTLSHYCCVLEYAPIRWQVNSKQLQLPLEIIQKRFAQLVSAVYYLYKCHTIAHRDLKPDNLLLTDEGDVRLIDFGLAMKCDKHLITTVDEKGDMLGNTLCGSPYYMAPELICDHNRQYNPFISDIWSLGVILYNTVYGQVPFPVRNIMELTRAIDRYAIPYPYECTATPLIRLLLQRDIKTRITLEDLVYHPFVDLKEWQKIHVPEPLPLHISIASTSSNVSTPIVSLHRSIPDIATYHRMTNHLPQLWAISRQYQKSYPMLWVPFLDVVMELLPQNSSSSSPSPPLDETPKIEPHMIDDDYFGAKTILEPPKMAPPPPPPKMILSASSSSLPDPMLVRWMEHVKEVCDEQKRKLNEPLTSQDLSNGWEELWKWAHENAIRGAVHQSTQKENDKAIQCYTNCCMAFYELNNYAKKHPTSYEHDRRTIATKWWQTNEQLKSLLLLGR